MRRDRTPIRSGLPRPLERRLMRRYGKGFAGRLKTAAALRALAVLLRRHPRAAADMAGAGLVQAGRVGIREARDRLRMHSRGGVEKPPSPKRRGTAEEAGNRKGLPPPAGRGQEGGTLSKRERRRFRQMLEEIGAARNRDGDRPKREGQPILPVM